MLKQALKTKTTREYQTNKAAEKRKTEKWKYRNVYTADILAVGWKAFWVGGLLFLRFWFCKSKCKHISSGLGKSELACFL